MNYYGWCTKNHFRENAFLVLGQVLTISHHTSGDRRVCGPAWLSPRSAPWAVRRPIPQCNHHESWVRKSSLKSSQGIRASPMFRRQSAMLNTSQAVVNYSMKQLTSYFFASLDNDQTHAERTRMWGFGDGWLCSVTRILRSKLNQVLRISKRSPGHTKEKRS